MGYIPLPRKSISVDVVDKKFDDTIFKQKAVFTGLVANVDTQTDELSIIIKTRVDLYSVKAGVVGTRVPEDAQFRSKEILLFANNNCLVYFNPTDPTDVRNGEVLYYKSSGIMSNVEQWAKVNLDGTLEPAILVENIVENVTKQGDLFGIMMDNPMVLNQLIIQNITAANSPMYNKYK